MASHTADFVPDSAKVPAQAFAQGLCNIKKSGEIRLPPISEHSGLKDPTYCHTNR